MNTSEEYKNGSLSIEVVENDTTIDVKWDGKSVEREPAKFISPILIKVLKMASDHNKRIIMDFRNLSYMNSSTITPIIKILDRAKKGLSKITIVYQRSLKWQELNFTALEVFATEDKRLEIRGV